MDVSKSKMSLDWKDDMCLDTFSEKIGVWIIYLQYSASILNSPLKCRYVDNFEDRILSKIDIFTLWNLPKSNIGQFWSSKVEGNL